MVYIGRQGICVTPVIPMTELKLKGLGPDCHVLVTAAARGIGRGIAEAFLASGCRVHVCDNDRPALSDFQSAHPGAITTDLDVADHQAVDAMFNAIERGGGHLDVLVNNAGIAGPVSPAEGISPEDWLRTIEVNLSSHFYFARRAIPMLRSRGGGSMLFIASSAAFMGCPMRAPYAASKWGLIGLVKTLAMELGKDAIRVNALCPGSVAGPRIERVMRREARTGDIPIEAIRQSYLKQSSMRVFMQPEDIANMALFLASELGAKISGQAIGLDGHSESFAQDDP